MENEVKVSVIIPVYNSEKFLSHSIESVLNQTYKNVEIISVNDGSSDKSLSILKQYEDQITIISQENQGLASAINVGIKNATGKWIKLFSADDILYPNAIETLLSHAKNLPTNTILYSNWDIIDEQNKKLRTFSESNYNGLGNFDYNVRLLDGQQININTALIPSSLFTRGCLIEKLADSVAIDYEFFLKAGILFNIKFHLVLKPLIQYRIHKGQLSHKKILKTLSYLQIVRNSILSQLNETKKEEYLNALQKYQKKKPIFKKTRKLGLNIISKTLPDRISDKIIIFYLNKIRTTRN
jgi:glycosyltransferase involved in cell wall biosynthesis